MGPHELGALDAPLRWAILIDVGFLVAVLLRSFVGWSRRGRRGGPAMPEAPRPGTGERAPTDGEAPRPGEREPALAAGGGRSP